MTLDRKIQRVVIAAAEKGVPFSINSLLNGSETRIEIAVYINTVRRLEREGDIKKCPYQPDENHDYTSTHFETTKTDKL